MGKLPRKQRPKRSHYASKWDYERALWSYSCSKSNINAWLRYTGNRRPSPSKKRQQRRQDMRMYAMMTHPGFGRV